MDLQKKGKAQIGTELPRQREEISAKNPKRRYVSEQEQFRELAGKRKGTVEREIALHDGHRKHCGKRRSIQEEDDAGDGKRKPSEKKSSFKEGDLVSARRR